LKERIAEVADLREEAMIMMLASGGFRIDTLVSLIYRHVREDLEANQQGLIF
jgi:site-specific recombinase XerD